MADEDNQEGLNLKDKLLLYPIVFVGGAFWGAFASLFDPVYLPRIAKEISSKKGRKLLKEEPLAISTGSLGSIGTYASLLSYYISNIVDNPDKPTSYIPAATNLIGLIALNRINAQVPVNQRVKLKHDDGITYTGKVIRKKGLFIKKYDILTDPIEESDKPSIVKECKRENLEVLVEEEQ